MFHHYLIEMLYDLFRFNEYAGRFAMRHLGNLQKQLTFMEQIQRKSHEDHSPTGGQYCLIHDVICHCCNLSKILNI